MSEETKPIPYFPKAPEVEKFELQQRTARLFAYSGLFSDIRGATVEQATAQAFVKIALGESMGFTVAESMTGIDIIKGRVAVGANLRAARMQRAGYGWEILQLDEGGCRLKLKLNGKPLYTEVIDQGTGELTTIQATVSFMRSDAERITSTDREGTKTRMIDKDNYRNYAPDMYFARAITRAQRWYAPGVLSLDVPTREEAELFSPPAAGEMPPEEKVNRQVAEKAKRTVEGIKAKFEVEGKADERVGAEGMEEPAGEFKQMVEAAQSNLEKRKGRQRPAPEMTQAGLVMEEF